MPQIFRRSTNTLARVSIVGAAVLAGAALWTAGQLQLSAYITGVGVEIEQPIPFSHRHHVGGVGLDCRYCHTEVEESSFAGIPPTATCMNCHSRLWSDSPTLEPVREAWRTGRPIAWTRVHKIGDFAYFDHSVHVAKGVACVTCHGRIDEMSYVYKSASLHMGWCLECHRHPERYVGPREAVFSMDRRPAEDQAALGGRLVREYNVRTRTDCSTCHR